MEDSALAYRKPENKQTFWEQAIKVLGAVGALCRIANFLIKHVTIH